MHSLGHLLYGMGSFSLTWEEGICFREPERYVAPGVPRRVKDVHGLLPKLPGVTVLQAARQSAQTRPHQPGPAESCKLGTAGL